MPDFFHKRMIATYARYIVRHRLALLFEKIFLLMTLKRHKVAQLRRVERTSLVMLFFVGRDEGGTTVIRR